LGVKRTLRIAGVAVGILAGIVLVGIGAISYGLQSMCGNDIVAEYPSPDGGMRVVVFVRNCGATTDFSTQASLLGPNTQLANSAGNLFTADRDHGTAPAGPKGGPELRVRWTGPSAVVLEHHQRARVFQAERLRGRIDVRYEVFQ
jgi:hypothetical protein